MSTTRSQALEPASNAINASRKKNVIFWMILEKHQTLKVKFSSDRSGIHPME